MQELAICAWRCQWQDHAAFMADRFCDEVAFRALAEARVMAGASLTLRAVSLCKS